MRWPLKNQVLFQMLLLVLLTMGAMTLASIRSAILESRAREQNRISEIRKLLNTARFPLTDSVLENMKVLSGVEYLAVDNHGQIVARTLAAPDSIPSPQPADTNSKNAAKLRKIQINGQPFYHDVVNAFQAVNVRSPVAEIHLFVPRQGEALIWWQASKTPLLIALLILPLALLVSLALANQVTRPLARLRKQVQEIAEGDRREIPPTIRDDEIRDLSLSINEMATKLLEHEKQLRQSERLRTMEQFGKGIAHHLRNSATGCQLALELFANESRAVAESENFQMANRQLVLINNYINRFLLLLKSSDQLAAIDTAMRPVDLNNVLERVVFLLQPKARHLNVKLTVDSSNEPLIMEMQPDDADQLMINLISNAIQAASQTATSINERLAVVDVELIRTDRNRITFSVTDNGPGPPGAIAADLFQPFVTGSSEGIGLGLSLVQDIANRAAGKISWERIQDRTRFTFEFGLSQAVEE